MCPFLLGAVAVAAGNAARKARSLVEATDSGAGEQAILSAEVVVPASVEFLRFVVIRLEYDGIERADIPCGCGRGRDQFQQLRRNGAETILRNDLAGERSHHERIIDRDGRRIPG